jgi:hypothetical protein
VVEKYAKKNLGEKEIESVLNSLDRLTLGESKMAVAQIYDLVCRQVNEMQVVVEGTHLRSVSSVSICTYRIRELDSVYGLDDIDRTTNWQAQSLYRCWLSCKDAFPSSLTQDDWVKDV